MNMKPVFDDLIRDEGLRLHPYLDTTGHLTVGVGHNLDANPLTPEQVTYFGHDARTEPITEDQALYLLSEDMRNLCHDMDHVLPWWKNVDDTCRRVLMNMGFNLGTIKLLKFTKTLDFMRVGDYASAAEAMLKTLWAVQNGERAVRLADILRYG